ncbi:FRAS1-related extracellular matrix protein 1 [Nephila pilipes]|uniref:FRAS1-related extracellular matrix protein 1 n=1 Tax=Nephila pilipes TaxID=299642 RepID=A0A8X6NUN5_NEPPI|nr:FRAS1-related extracellular matrix protein 1 [Nephila pilipes]
MFFFVLVSNRTDVPSCQGTFITEVLAATDVDTEDLSLYFILTEAPQFGNVVLDKRKTNRFTQKDIVNEEVFYVHNNQEIGANPKEDSMTYIVTDKAFPRLMPHNSHKVFITILPQNTQSPRLYFKRAILVEEGQSSAVTEENLSATDEDTFPGELLIVISRQPGYGYLENSRPSPGYEKSKRNKRISAFPLQDVKDGFITFVQSNHSGIEPESDDFEVFVTDGVHNSTVVLVYVSIVLLNDEIPYFSLSNITVDEGNSYLMNNESLIAGDRDYPGDILVLSVKNKPRHGSLTHFLKAVNNGPLLEISFNQLTLENFEKIMYHHDDSENFIDSFSLTLNDGVHSVIRTCFVEVNPINDEPPVLKKNIGANHVELQSNYIISSAVLYSEDADSNPSEILYKISKPVAYGNLEKNSQNGDWILLDPLEFSQDEINLNHIRYQQISKPSSTYEDSFSFFLSDGLNKSPSSTFILKLVDFGKSTMTVFTQKFVLEHGEQPIYGSIIYNQNRYHPEKFSQKDIEKGLISYKAYSNFSKNDAFAFKVTSEREENVAYHRNQVLGPTVFQIFKSVEESPIVYINSPTNLENVWHNHLGFSINSYNLKATYSNSSAKEIKFSLTKYLDHGYLFHVKEERIIRTFSQEDINEQLIVIILKSKAETYDYFTFHVSVNESTFPMEYRMDFQWAVVYFPHAEYSVCEDSGSLNIMIQRSGNANVSSYVTISAIEQTAKEGLDYVSRRVSKIQFDPGTVDTIWKIVIVKDDLEEAPIEQLQVTLTDPENCIIINHNRTIVSIYDLNRGSCSQIPKGEPPNAKLIDNYPVLVNSNDDSEEGNGDSENMNYLNFPMECNQYIYDLLHFETYSQTLYQCDGEKWIPWYPKTSSTQINSETLSFDSFLNHEISTTEDFETSTVEELTSKEMTTHPSFEIDSCMKGWQIFAGKCYKWYKSPAAWDKAAEVCKNYLSSNLVTVESIEHNNWLLQLARNKPFWIGLHAIGDTNNWSYLEPGGASFVNWKKGFPRLPTNADSKNRCTLVRGSGLWINKNCETHEHSYICSMPLYAGNGQVTS